ncbi:MAG TPA: glycosyltransferase family 2 protein [Patescibacteria group bacterium]|nr:glycosyltransferase family 2 protein [Patescibacteria group bacterium]
MQTENAPEISVIICTYNTKELTFDCLQKLEKSAKRLGRKVEIIVVENGTDGTGEAIEKIFPGVKVITPKENTGFAKGNNIGLEASNKNSKYVLLLNSDALVNPDTLKKSVEFMEKNPDCDVMGPRLKFANGRFQPSAGFLPKPFSIATWISGADLVPALSHSIRQFHPKYKSFFEKTREVGWVMGAYFFARREVLEKTKGFDTTFFMYLEEVDLCKRIKDMGMKIFYTPDFEITHLDKASVGGDWRKPTIREIQGIAYYMKKYYKNHIWWLMPFIKLSLILRIIAFALIGKFSRSDTYREALISI